MAEGIAGGTSVAGWMGLEVGGRSVDGACAITGGAVAVGADVSLGNMAIVGTITVPDCAVELVDTISTNSQTLITSTELASAMSFSFLDTDHPPDLVTLF